MRLSELLSGLAGLASADTQHPRDPVVTGITHDSRRVAAGDLFVALPGQRFDGRQFAAAAAERGAVAIVAAPPGRTPSAGPAGLPWGLPASLPWIAAADPRDALAALAGRLYGHPDRELVMAGVTGTNGKTTVALLIAAALDAAGLASGFVGTLGYRFGDHRFPGSHTTPEASDLFRTLRQMRQAGARAVAMEVSSHALAMRRAAGVAFDVAVFTNLTRDHLDYHRDMEEYFATKRRLFAQLKPGGRAAVNRADPFGRRLAGELQGAITYGDGGDVSVRNARLLPRGRCRIEAELATPRGPLAIASPLVGRYNLDNLLAAAAAAEVLALPHGAVAAAFAARQPVPGRMEPVERGQPFAVFVDYAHTDAALAAALRSLREVAGGGKLAVVFGCGGDRDPGKRPLMGRIAGELADLPILTSDNPRGEDPLAILAAVEEGVRASGNPHYRVVPDRREAIRLAVAAAEPGWAVLVAGKGHEREQVIGDRRLPFSDLEEVGQALEERFGG